MLEKMMEAAKRWHDKTNQPPLEGGMPTTRLGESGGIMNVTRAMKEGADFAEEMAKQPSADPRWLRIQLWLEECAEKVAGCVEGDKLETLDGICDSLYVDAGAAHRFGMNLIDAYARSRAKQLTPEQLTQARIWADKISLEMTRLNEDGAVALVHTGIQALQAKQFDGPLLSTPLASISETRSANTLERVGVLTIGDLLNCSEEQLMAVREFGGYSLLGLVLKVLAHCVKLCLKLEHERKS